MMQSELLRLYLVADPDHCDGDLGSAVQAAIDGGVTCVQLRAKSLTDREQLDLAIRLRDMCHAASIPFIVNDRLDIALASRADGIHVGVDDMPVESIRALTKADFIVGYSPDTDEQIGRSGDEGVDYLGVGPVFGTRTKSDAGVPLGMKEFRRRCSISPIPVVGIGGITVGNTASILEAGGAGVAVVSAILSQPDAAEAARELRRQSGI